MITVVLQIQDSSQDTSEKARVVLEGVPGVRRVLMDPVGRALVVRGDQRPGDLRRILSDAGMHSTIVSASSLRPILKRMDNAAIAVLILAAQLVLTRWSFGVDRAFLHAAQAGASAFVFAVLGFPLLRAAATSALQKSVSLELVIVVGAFCAWVAGALSAIRLEGLAQPYSVLASV
jgi:cation transport ATPase